MDLTATEFLKLATSTAEHFGFQSVDALRARPECKNCTVKLANKSSAAERKQDSLHGLLSGGINFYTGEKLYSLDEPIFFYNVENVPKTGEAALTLHVFGVEKSIAEAILIQATRSLANDLGFIEQTVRINSMGDTDSQNRYTRELNNFFKKRLDTLPNTARELMKEHSIATLLHLLEKENELAYKSPSPLEFLSDPSRRHFRDIVEYLDMSETPYEIDSKLIGHHNCYSDVLFAIDLLDNEGRPLSESPIQVQGGRYNNFMQRHLGKNVPAVGAVVVLKNKKAPQRTPRVARKQPSVYVVHLGFGPKVKSLMLVSNLRQAGVPVYQNLASDSLSDQLRDAENKKVKYTVIIGQKEFVDNTAILRDMFEQNQESVPLETLANKLKKTCAA